MNAAIRKLPSATDARAPVRSKASGRDVDRRKDARPIKRILERTTGKMVGWLYEWDTGTVVPMWLGVEFETDKVDYADVGTV